jgi:predicted site-specific integrase-resolvase
MPIEINGKKYYWTLECCRLANISRSTLLRWLGAGAIAEPIKDRRGWRLFSETDMNMIREETKRTRPS